MMPRIIAAVVIVGLLTGLLVWSQQRAGPLRVSGFIEADEIRVGSHVGGRMAKVPAEEGNAVAVGDVLVELEPYELRDRRAEAAATLAQRTAEHDKLVAGPRRQEIAAAEARLADANAEQKIAQQAGLSACAPASSATRRRRTSWTRPSISSPPPRRP